MTNRELLELAAKAAGINLADAVDSSIPSGGLWVIGNRGDTVWNPLTDDGDAMRLAVRLRITVELRDHMAAAAPMGEPFLVIGETYCDNGGNEFAATRRAIVRAAAEIGKNA